MTNFILVTSRIFWMNSQVMLEDVMLLTCEKSMPS